jgi:putative transposase
LPGMKLTRMSTATEFQARLTDAEWAVLEPLVPANKPGGRPPKYTRRAILDAIRYAVRQGGTWRALPPDLPHWNTAFWYFSEWQKDGTWDRVEDALRRAVRKAEGREHAEPSAGIADSQTVRATEQPGPRGFDGGKKDHRHQAARVRRYARAGLGAGRHPGRRA